MKSNMIIRQHQHDNGKRTYSVHYIFDEIGNQDATALCELPTLEQAAALVRYLNGGNMSKEERETVRAALEVESRSYRKAQKKAAAQTV